MSSNNLNPVLKSHPEMAGVVDRVGGWMEENSQLGFLEFRTVVSDLGSELSGQELLDFFDALTDSGLVRVYYRVIDNDGMFTDSIADSALDLPKSDMDRNGNQFIVRRRNIAQIHEFV